MDRRSEGSFKRHQDLFPARTCFEGGANVAPSSVRIEIRTSSVQRNANQLDRLPWQNTASPRIGGHLDAGLCPRRVPIAQLRNRRVPRASFTCLVFGGHCGLLTRNGLLPKDHYKKS